MDIKRDTTMDAKRDTTLTAIAAATPVADSESQSCSPPDPHAGSHPDPHAGSHPDPHAGSHPDPYAAILELAELELQLARDGRIEDLHSLAPQWDALTASLPEQPPISARGPLESAAALHERTSATLACLREALLCDLRTTARASRAARGYAEAPRRVHRMDHSA
jgi:hypothetical protein